MIKEAVLLTLLFAASAQAYPAVVTKVIDGDTIRVAGPAGTEDIRLYGVDSPEKKQTFGAEARNYTQLIVDGRVVDIYPVGLDLYGRTLAIVETKGSVLQENLLKQGYAWVYTRYCTQPVCSYWQMLQDISSSNKAGLWQDEAPIKPWEWRRGKR